MDEKELEIIIKNDESETVEFKKSTAQLEKSLKAVCAFLNHTGGTIFFGIEKKNIIGQDVSDLTLKSISQKIRQRIKPEISPEIHVFEIKGKKIIEVKIKEGNNKLYYLDGIAYKRVGSENVIIPPDEIERVLFEKKKKYWDLEICEGTVFADINLEKIEQFRSLYEGANKIKLKGSDEDVLISLGCLKVVNKKYLPTNAGILLFGTEPQKFFSNAAIRIAIYPGITTGTEHVDIKEFEGDLFLQVNEAEAYIRRYVYTPSILKSGHIEREETPQYSYFILRELIVNAVVHRDYSITGSKILIKIFNNRIEYQSPGSLPAGITPENIVREQFLRNRAIGKAFNKIKYIEEMGEGWDRIIEETKNNPLKPPMPKIEATKASVIVNLFSAELPKPVKIEETAVNEWLTKVNASLMYELSDKEKVVLAFAIKNSRITSADCQKLLEISRVMANRYFVGLIQKKILIRKGQGKSTYYVLQK